MMPVEKHPTSSSSFQFEPESHRKKQISGIKFMLGCFLFFAGIAATIGLITVATQAFQFMSFSHQYLYQNQSLDAVNNRSLVVQPLIGDGQAFDLVVTVWYRVPLEERHVARQSRHNHTATAGHIHNHTATATSTNTTNVANTTLVASTDFERAVYSDTVFKGLRLGDKHVFADVNFSIPTKIFLDQWLWSHSLYAYIQLIPNSPSLLDHVESVSALGTTWGRRSNPFPLGSNNTKYNETMPTEHALHAMGLRLPLLQLLEIPSICETPTEDFESDADFDNGTWRHRNSFYDNEHNRKNHPFIITRSHIVAARETHLFNKKAVYAARKRSKLGRFDCRGDTCRRNYYNDGNLEVLLKLGIPSETGNRTEYAYGPYLHSVPVAGPLDLFQVPVNRENCSMVPGNTTPISSNISVPEFVNVTWHLSFSGRSPSQIILSEKLQRSDHESLYGYTWDPNAGDYTKNAAHNAFEMINGLIHDHKASEDSHPRRKLVFTSALLILSALTWLLDLHYWYTCTSTTTVSIPGNAMISLASLVYATFNFVAIAQQTRPLGLVPWTWLLFRKVLLPILTPILALKAVLRLDFGWKKMTPDLKRLPPSRSERHSEHVEAKTPWIVRGGIFIFLAVGYWILTPEDIYLIEPTAAMPTPGEVPRNNIRMFTSSLYWTGVLSQLTLNQRFRVFSGSYRTTIMLHVLGDLISLLFHLPSVMGRVQFHWGIPVDWVFGMMIRVLLAFQAVMYPPHKIADEIEEDVE